MNIDQLFYNHIHHDTPITSSPCLRQLLSLELLFAIEGSPDTMADALLDQLQLQVNLVVCLDHSLVMRTTDAS